MKTIDHLPHTADIRIRLTADSVQELFEAALDAMNQILKEGECERQLKPTIRKFVHIRSTNLTTLLVEFMSEVLTLSYTCNALFCTLYAERLTDAELAGILTGIDVPGFDEDIKAVTYHEAEVIINPKGKFETVVVFDI